MIHRAFWIHGTVLWSAHRTFWRKLSDLACSEQVRILPMNDDLLPYAESCLKELKAKKIRATIDAQSAKLGAKIRRAETDKIPHMFVIGKREAEEGKNFSSLKK